VRGFRSNEVPGKIEILVNVSHQGQTGRATITQFNMDVPKTAVRKSGSGKIIGILAVVGGAAAGGAIAATRRGQTAAPAPAARPPIVITPGSGTVGAPAQ
jgi:hypothetical protein